MKILMVCLGNICRSPLAEGIMRHLINQQGLRWEVASAGTGNWHVGCAPDHRSIAVAKRFGYDIAKQKAQHFTADFFERYDHILVMDKDNYKNVLNLASTDAHKNKVQLFLANEAELVDPYYQDDLFEPVFKQVEARCKELIEAWK